MRPVPSTLEQWKCDERRGELYRGEEMPSFLPFNGWKSLKFLTSHESQRVREDMKVQFPTRRIFVANVRWTFLFIFLFLLHFSFSFRDSRATYGCRISSLLSGYVSFLLARKGEVYSKRGPFAPDFDPKILILSFYPYTNSKNGYISQKSNPRWKRIRLAGGKIFALRKIWFRQESIITKFIARAHFFVREFDIPIAGEK